MEENLRRGAENLLCDCAGLGGGDALLIVQEPPGLGYYDQAIADAIVETARDLGIRTRLLDAPVRREPGPLPETLRAAMRRADRSLFLARLGDQIRFSPDLAQGQPIMCYALDAGMLGSGFGRAAHAGLVALKGAVNDAMAAAREIRVTCPLGTDFAGPSAEFPPDGPADVAISRFPLSVFAPVLCAGFAGKVVQRGFLVGTGSRYYTPYARVLDAPVEVHFDGHRITGFTGPDRSVVDIARAHFRWVAESCGTDAGFIHSWHAGIHPGCDYRGFAADNFERWSGGAFGNPRLLHLHSCGTRAPGEISLNVLDPTICLDGVALWDHGRLHPERLAGGAAIMARYSDLAALFASPAQGVGQGRDGQLSG